jgi:glutamate/tyrosine decarboxylase-like PLP-dependent enzyme
MAPTDRPDDHDALLADAAARAASYRRGAASRPVAPTAEALAGLARFGVDLPDEPTPPAAVLDELDRFGSPSTVVSNGGRYFGFVTGGTDPAAQAAAVLAGAWDQNVALPVMSPVAAHLDELAARWVGELLGLPATTTATFCGGASVANLIGILAGRDALLERAGWDVGRRGLWGAPPLRVVTGAEAHLSVFKALRAAGFGRDTVTLVATDEAGRIDAGALGPLDEQTLVVLQAGNVNTGHSDPFEPLIARARAAGAWVHVDGAFGLWAAASPTRRAQVAGVEGADSWATDAHKWLNVPYDSGIAACARVEDLHRLFATDAAYATTTAARAAMHLSPQMSQRARGVEVWATLRSLGRHGVAALVDRCCELTSTLAERLAGAGIGARVLAPVVLNQALVHLDDDATTDAVIEAVQHHGVIWAGATTWHGVRAMRLSVSDHATTAADIDAAVGSIVHCRRALGGAGHHERRPG